MRGFAAWFASKISVLIFATAVFSLFVYYYGFVTDFQDKDAFAKTADNIARFVETVGAAPYRLSAMMDVEKVSEIRGSTSGNNVLEISGSGLTAQKKISVSVSVPSPLSAPTKIRAESNGAGVVTLSKV